jgi:hypothetical protein
MAGPSPPPKALWWRQLSYSDQIVEDSGLISSKPRLVGSTSLTRPIPYIASGMAIYSWMIVSSSAHLLSKDE